MLNVPPAHPCVLGLGLVPRTGRADVRVGARTDAPPVVAAPVAEVVPARVRTSLSAPRPVAHLVPLEPGRRQQRVGELVLRGLVVLVGQRELAPPDLREHPRSRLDDERVRRHVVDPRREHGLDAGPPVGQGLARGAVDEVERDVEARVARPRDDVGDAARVVRAVEGREDVRHRRLHPEAHAREARVGERVQRLGAHRVRVRLGRDLDALREAPGLPDPPEQAGQVVGRQHRRGTAPEEHGGHGSPAQPGVVEHAGREVELAQRRVRVRDLRRAPAQLGRRVRVEVAVPAAHRAERDVHVDAERALAPGTGTGRARRRGGAHPARERAVVGHGLPLGQRRAHFFFASLPESLPPAESDDSAAMNASWGTSTRPMVFMRFLPSFCFSSSLRLRVMSPP